MGPGSGDSISIRLSNDTEMVAFARLVLRHTLEPLDDLQDPLFYGAFTEVVTNAIEEHRRLGIAHDVEVRVSLGGRPEIAVRDHGQGFDPNMGSDPQPEPQSESGRGLVIARSVVPGMRIESSPVGSMVFLPYPVRSEPAE